MIVTNSRHVVFLDDPINLQEEDVGGQESEQGGGAVSEDCSSCWVYIASGCQIYKLQIPLEASLISEGKESLLIPVQTEVMNSLMVNRCPHRSEIQSIVLAETESTGYSMLGTVDSYGHLIVSKLDTIGTERLTYSVLPRDCGIGESGWAGLCFSPTQWSTAAVARSFCKTIDVYDQDIHVRTLCTLWYPSSLKLHKKFALWERGLYISNHRSSSTGNIAVGGADRTVTIYDPRRWSALSRWVHCSKYEITGLAFSSVDSDYIYIQGVDYEVFCGQWKESSKCQNKDVLGGWCDSGSIFVADVVAKESDTSMLQGFANGSP
ncbi:hypothetical protein Prudu_021240 [Prunus dulcis]|uniref:Transducin/WD40 repeat-like superfamily protein n=1 Tax=Prunus dulcis TaxID=3755 RepID=A0A4Y1RWX6_PRUDU|nr:hypothetical protein Prudu_021240 [Prunus dulcis]